MVGSGDPRRLSIADVLMPDSRPLFIPERSPLEFALRGPITHGELMSPLRQQGINNPANVRLASLGDDSSISVIRYDEQPNGRLRDQPAMT